MSVSVRIGNDLYGAPSRAGQAQFRSTPQQIFFAPRRLCASSSSTRGGVSGMCRNRRQARTTAPLRPSRMVDGRARGPQAPGTM